MKLNFMNMLNDTDVELDIEKEDMIVLEKEITLSNIKRMRIIAWFVLIFEPLIIAVIDIPRLQSSSAKTEWIYLSYLICHVTFLVASFPALIMTNHIERKKERIQKWAHIYMAILVPLVALSMFGYIDILDQIVNGEGMVYLINVIILCTVYLMPPPKNVLIFAIPHVVYIGLNLFFFPKASILSSSIVNGTTMIATMVVFNSILYYNFLNHLKKNFALKKKNDDLEYLASHDMLTKLKNRSAFAKYIESQQAGILMLVDLDYFKNVNDTYSHLAGDFILKEFAYLMKESFFDATVARWGGEEFIVFWTQTDMELVSKRAHEFRIMLMQHEFIFENKIIKMTASFGMTQIRQDYEQAFIRMDRALYQAKEKGRNTIVQIPFSE